MATKLVLHVDVVGFTLTLMIFFSLVLIVVFTKFWSKVSNWRFLRLSNHDFAGYSHLILLSIFAENNDFAARNPIDFVARSPPILTVNPTAVAPTAVIMWNKSIFHQFKHLWYITNDDFSVEYLCTYLKKKQIIRMLANPVKPLESVTTISLLWEEVLTVWPFQGWEQRYLIRVFCFRGKRVIWFWLCIG